MIRFLTAGESHGQGLVVIVEGMPAGLSISEEYIGTQMARRQRGHGRGGRMQIEKDWAHVVSGIRHGRTLGSPIAMTIENRDWVNWTTVMSVNAVEEEVERVTRIRPGHADLPGTMKYGYDDVSGRAGAVERTGDGGEGGGRGGGASVCWRSSAWRFEATP